MSLKGKLQSQPYDGFRGLQLIPLVIRYAGGTPSIVHNPANEAIALTDTGTGDVKLVLASASVAPLFAFVEALPANAGAAGVIPNLKTAPTRDTVEILVNAATDGTTETDPVDLHVLLIKTVEGTAA
jgi:hypothetical protein